MSRFWNFSLPPRSTPTETYYRALGLGKNGPKLQSFGYALRLSLAASACFFASWHVHAQDIPIDQTICTAILEHGIRDERIITRNTSFHQKLKLSFCDEESKTANQIRGDAASLGVSFGDLTSSFGLSAGSARNNSKLEQEYRRFCSDESRNFVLESSYGSSASTLNEMALRIYSDCVRDYRDTYIAHQRKVHITVVPAKSYDEFEVELAYSGTLADPLVVNSITKTGGIVCKKQEPAGLTMVESGTVLARSTILSCAKDPDQAIEFALAIENAAVSNRVLIPAARNEYDEEIDRLKQHINDLEKSRANLSSELQDLRDPGACITENGKKGQVSLEVLIFNHDNTRHGYSSTGEPVRLGHRVVSDQVISDLDGLRTGRRDGNRWGAVYTCEPVTH